MDYRAYKLERIEANFKATLNAAGRQFKAADGEFPGVVKLTSVDTKGFYYQEKVPKQKIALHGTAGVLHGDIWTLTQNNNHVSVAYVVARDGTAYQLFPDEYWSYHLGGSSSAPNTQFSRSSVAIEISNLLGLKESPTDSNVLIDAYSKPYCSKADKQFYTELPEAYRGYKYWASFTDAQYEAVSTLVQNLCDKYKLPLTKLPLAKAYDWFPQATNTTIFLHTNCRKDKIDFSPAFDLNRIGPAEVAAPVEPIVAPQPKPTPTAPIVISTPTSHIYKVQSGDTFFKISAQLRIPIKSLFDVNPGVDPTKLQVGQEIKLP